MKIAIVDDDPKDIKNLSQIIADSFHNKGYEVKLIDSFLSGEEFLHIWQPEMYDIVILDMFMYELSGVDVAKKMREADNSVKLVFCTTSNDFASESYSVNASYYLRKPIDTKGVQSMIERINSIEHELVRFITLSDGQRLILRNIIYTEYYNHTIFIYNKIGESIKSRITQAEFAELVLDFPYLYACGKGFIVNLYEIVGRDKDVFLMSNGSRVPISRRRAKEISDTYTNFLFNRMREEMND
ncbi:MAG: LytTR family DNA-binding domain-containing protein [Oscillospiraceae bacterium]|jgi:DNA-binding LytR/AlgR family response regulator